MIVRVEVKQNFNAVDQVIYEATLVLNAAETKWKTGEYIV